MNKMFGVHKILERDEAIGILPVPHASPITVIGTKAIREGFDDVCFEQAINSRLAPGVTDLVLNPDAHAGYGAPVGCVMVSPTHIYPGPVGVDIKCSMSLLQLNIPDEVISEKKLRRELIRAIGERIPTGAGKGQRSVRRSRKVSLNLGKEALINGAAKNVCEMLGIPADWSHRCEDSFHVGHNGSPHDLANRLDFLLSTGQLLKLDEKIFQLGSYGGGNHFGECNVVQLQTGTDNRDTAKVFGLVDNHVAFLSHCGSRGIGHYLASNQFRTLQKKFSEWRIPFPGNDKELVYAPLGTKEADDYIDDMSLGANFATVNHLLINALVLEAFQEILPGTKGNLVYFISHNIAKQEMVRGMKSWVHRKGATRAFPKDHEELRHTPFYESGHPILLPGNPREGSAVMVAKAGAEKSLFSVNHGAGRAMGRRAAMRTLNQKIVDEQLEACDILSNCRQYPLDEAPDAYKNFSEVLSSVEKAGLASTIAKLKARFVIKDGDISLKGAA